MRLILKADDYGYTARVNDGTIRAIEHGVLTTVDIMLDTPGAEDGLVRMRDYPWISVSWHSNHLWGRPSVDPSLVPTMVQEDGRFKWREDENIQKTASYADARRDWTAQVEKCIKFLGRAPDCVKVRANDWDLERAKRDVCEEYGIPINVYDHYTGLSYDRKSERVTALEPADPKWKHCNIVQLKFKPTPGGLDWDIGRFRSHYKPEEAIKDNDFSSYGDATLLRCYSPGFLDDYVLKESTKTIARVRDVQALCSKEYHDWLLENHVELLSITDAMYGRRDYQNHLRDIGSDLYVPAE